MGFDGMDVSTIWQSGECKGQEDATVYALIYGLHYGAGVFEGVRAYDADRGPATFRWEGHLERLYQPAEPYNMEISYTREELTEATLEVIRRNDLDGGYIRPIVFYGHDSFGVSPKDNPTGVVIAAWPWGTCPGEDALEDDVDVTVSSWREHTSSQIPANVEATGLYVNSVFADGEARRNGYVGAVVLNEEGNVVGGPGENIFMVRDGKIYTPGPSQSILDGIVRDTVVTLVRERGREVDDSATISRGKLSTVDELSSTGSAAEVTPVCKVDNVVIGEGTRGPVTEELQSAFSDLTGRRADDHEE